MSIIEETVISYSLCFTSQRFIKERKKKYPEEEIAVATKFAALPWRLGRQSVIAALKDSLSRLELDSVELYQLHWFVLYLFGCLRVGLN